MPLPRRRWPAPDCPSSIENNGIFIDLHNNNGAIGYGIEAFQARNPLAWPGFADEAEVKGLPSVVISVNECDPLRDEGINFYRLLVRSGVNARCRQMMGTIHATEVFPALCPDISRDTAQRHRGVLQGVARSNALRCHPRESGDPECDAEPAESGWKPEAAEPYDTGFPLSRE